VSPVAATLAVLRTVVGERDATQRVSLNRVRQPMTRSGIYSLVRRTVARACGSPLYDRRFVRLISWLIAQQDHEC
jgi:hypothetical protein